MITIYVLQALVDGQWVTIFSSPNRKQVEKLRYRMTLFFAVPYRVIQRQEEKDNVH